MFPYEATIAKRPKTSEIPNFYIYFKIKDPLEI